MAKLIKNHQYQENQNQKFILIFELGLLDWLFFLCKGYSWASIPALLANHSKFCDDGRSMGRPYILSQTNDAKTPNARETPNKTV